MKDEINYEIQLIQIKLFKRIYSMFMMGFCSLTVKIRLYRQPIPAWIEEPVDDDDEVVFVVEETVRVLIIVLENQVFAETCSAWKGTVRVRKLVDNVTEKVGLGPV